MNWVFWEKSINEMSEKLEETITELKSANIELKKAHCQKRGSG